MSHCKLDLLADINNCVPSHSANYIQFFSSRNSSKNTIATESNVKFNQKLVKPSQISNPS